MRPIMFASFLVTCAATAVAAQTCEIPAAYTNQVVVEDGDLRVRYATDRSTYNPSDNVQFYLVVENLGATTFSINWGIDPQDGHFILRAPFESLEDCCATDADIEANVLYYLPSILFFFSAGTTIAPGQCRIWQRTIDLEWATNPAPGTYAVLGGMLHVAPSGVPGLSYDKEFVAPQGGAKLYINIVGPVSTSTSTWGRVKALYR